MKNNRLNIFKYFLKEYPLESLILFIALSMAVIAELIGVFTLMPLFSLVTNTQNSFSDLPFLSNFFEFFDNLNYKNGLAFLLFIIFFASLVKAVLLSLSLIFASSITLNVEQKLRIETMNSVMSAKWLYYLGMPSGSIINSVSVEAARSSGMYTIIIKFFTECIRISLILAFTLLIDFKVTLLSVLCGFLIIISMSKLVSMTSFYGKLVAASLKDLTIQINEILHNIKPLKSMSLAKFISPLIIFETKKLKDNSFNIRVLKILLVNIREPIIIGLMVVGIYFANIYFDIDFSKILILGILFHRASNSLATLQSNYQNIVSNEHFFYSLINTINKAKEEKEDLNDKGKIYNFHKNIKFVNLSYRYPKKMILESSNLTIDFKKLTVLIGSSGIGKTTVADLICYLLKPSSGDILVDDINLSNINLDHWRSRIGYVPQDTVLFHDTILKNITLGDDTISINQVNKALKLSGATNFIENLLDKLNTVVGEKGSKLSGGQRQRIAIARALVRNPKILILDEATSSLDKKSELELINTFKNISQEITIFAITHKPALLSIADKIYSIKDKKILLESQSNK